MSNHELAFDTLVANPIDETTRQLLVGLDVPPESIDHTTGLSRAVAELSLRSIGKLLEVEENSGEYADKFLPGDGADDFSVEENLISANALTIGSSEKYTHPTDKLVIDSRCIDKLLNRLGPTNQLRNEHGLDAGIDLGTLANLVSKDYLAIPEADRRPEMRLTEGILREELALLWRPDGLQEARENTPDTIRNFMFDLEDPNLFSPEDIQRISEDDRWKLIGVALADDAKNTFAGIKNSPTATWETKVAALSRYSDMSTRSLRIKRDIAVTDAKKESLFHEAETLSRSELKSVQKIWNKWSELHNPDGSIPKRGLLAESVQLARMRVAEIRSSSGEASRLALPREDTVDKNLPHFRKGSEEFSLSADIVTEDAKGRFVSALQVKSMSEANYLAMEDRSAQEKGYRKTYLAGRIVMAYVS